MTNANEPAHSIHVTREQYSLARLEELQNELKSLPELKAYEKLTIYATGSFGRLEASEYSDIDLFFVNFGERHDLEEPRTKELRLLGRIIEIVERLKFPKFSNDCEYLHILHSGAITENLGSPLDDHENYFTARLLLLLESRCLYGEEAHNALIEAMVGAYFRDYPDHKHTFQPVFLLNDICRFWKTLLLNYEHKRNLPVPESERASAKTKVRNFKLKYSRMTTCFATVAALGSFKAPVTEEQVRAITAHPPRARLLSVLERVPEAKAEVEEILSRYDWFLEMTGLTTPELEDRFSDKQKRTEMFAQANSYGNAMYNLLRRLDTVAEHNFLRYVVI